MGQVLADNTDRTPLSMSARSPSRGERELGVWDLL
jgi:hypothetical protein